VVRYYQSRNVNIVSSNYILFRLRLPISTLFPYTTLFRSLWHAYPFACRYGQSTDPCSVSFCENYRDLSNAVELFHTICADQVRRSEEHTSELQSRENLVCRLLLEKKIHTNKHCDR